jgi:hypothetical protein
MDGYISTRTISKGKQSQRDRVFVCLHIAPVPNLAKFHNAGSTNGFIPAENIPHRRIYVPDFAILGNMTAKSVLQQSDILHSI